MLFFLGSSVFRGGGQTRLRVSAVMWSLPCLHIYLYNQLHLSVINLLHSYRRKKLHLFLFQFPQWMFSPLYLSVWCNILSKIATSDVHVLPVCVPACWGPLIMNAESRGLWMEALRAFDRQRIIEDGAQQTDWSGFSRRCSVCVYMCTVMWLLPTVPLVQWWH